MFRITTRFDNLTLNKRQSLRYLSCLHSDSGIIPIKENIRLVVVTHQYPLHYARLRVNPKNSNRINNLAALDGTYYILHHHYLTVINNTRWSYIVAVEIILVMCAG